VLGSKVVDIENQPGGFSEGLAALARLASGRRVFIKAVSSLTIPAVAAFHRREIAISQRLPRAVPAPRLVDTYDDGTWVALILEPIPGRLPDQPWRRDELDRVLAAVVDLAEILTPSPIDASILGAPRLGGWRALADEPAAVTRLARLNRWAADHIDQLVALEERSALVSAGTTLLHGDLYPFNLMLTADRVFAVDWPHAWIGAPYCDAVTLLANTSLSGIDPQPIAETHPLTRDLDPAHINVFLALHAGFLFRIASTAGPSADPNLLDMMVALGRGSLHWLRDRL
jgi:hypothetical protein